MADVRDRHTGNGQVFGSSKHFPAWSLPSEALLMNLACIWKLSHRHFFQDLAQSCFRTEVAANPVVPNLCVAMPWVSRGIAVSASRLCMVKSPPPCGSPCVWRLILGLQSERQRHHRVSHFASLSFTSRFQGHHGRDGNCCFGKCCASQPDVPPSHLSA